MRLLFAAFFVIPLIEIALFIAIGQAVGLWPTLLGVLATAVIGSFIVRRQGLSLIGEIRRTTAAGALPARQLAEAMMIGVAGALLFTPGYFTDAMGLLLLAPAVRGGLYDYLKRHITIVTPGPHGPGHGGGGGPDVIDLDDGDWRRNR